MKKLVSLALALFMLVGMIPFASAETYTEAPFWAGHDLPPVAERMPTEPMVENADYLEIGVYGGELKRSADTGKKRADEQKLPAVHRAKQQLGDRSDR